MRSLSAVDMLWKEIARIYGRGSRLVESEPPSSLPPPLVPPNEAPPTAYS